jgi:hypothetical protein
MSSPSSRTIRSIGSAGCKFVDRCPRATLPCLQTALPPLYTDHYRAVFYYLYCSTPALAVAEMGKAFTVPARASCGG